VVKELARGRLVRWLDGHGQPYGYVKELAANAVTVQLDGLGERMFVRSGAPLEVVDLPPQVRRKSNDEPGFLLGPVDAAEVPMWRVQFLTGIRKVPEADLRPDFPTEPVSLIEQGKTGSPQAFNLRTIARYYQLEHLHNALVSLSNARVDIKPHQVGVAHRVVSSYPHRFLLCDEVGLGKTIEAGMILKELRARGGAERTLCVVPPNLTRQWQFELKSKFNEVFSILNTDTIRHLRNQGMGGNPFVAFDSVIVSSAWITSKEHRKAVVEAPWDMIIVDEAHHARRRAWGNKTETTLLYRLIAELAQPQHYSKRSLLFLTATPMQLGSDELYALIELLDPALFPSEVDFDRHRKEVPGLSRLVDVLREHGFPPPAEDPDEVVEEVAGWLGIDERLARKRLRAGADEIEALCGELAERHLLSEVLIRNRKVVVGGFMPRHATRWQVHVSEEELQALREVEAYVLESWDRATARERNSVGFVMTIFQRMMASSIRALRTSLEKRGLTLLGKIESAGLASTALEDAVADDPETQSLVASAPAFAEEADVLEGLIARLDAVPRDSKALALVANMRIIREEEANPKVLIFTEFRETQEYLAGLLAHDGWGVNLFHGQMSPERKDGSVETFRDSDGPQVLISTDSGGEGRNFQFCHLLVNYDLPWNPMKVEQRIGRVDRIGQDHVVEIFNMWVEGTVEERILDVLERRIRVFEDTIGSLDPILGEAERDIREIMRKRAELRERALEKFERDLGRRVEDARKAEERLRDFIMDTKSYSREIAERISGETSPITAADQERFVRSLLHSVRTFIEDRPTGESMIVFHEPFISDYPDLSRERMRLVTFRPDRKRDSEQVEYLAFGHPIVDALVDRVLESGGEGSATGRMLLEGEDLPPVSGWLFNFVVGVPGFRAMQRFLPIFIADSGVEMPAVAEALLRRSLWLQRERPADIPETGLQEAAERADGAALRRMTELQEEAQVGWRTQSDRERDKLEAYFQYRERSAQDKLAATHATLDKLEKSDDPETRRIIPVWRANLERDRGYLDELTVERERRLAELDRLAEPMGDYELLNVARIEVVTANA
jgi:ATP-dependent helicase HepA